MRCSSTIAAGFACLGIKPGDACASPYAFLHNFFDHVSLTARHNVYTMWESAWIALSAPTQGMAARFFALSTESDRFTTQPALMVICMPKLVACWLRSRMRSLAPC